MSFTSGKKRKSGKRSRWKEDSGSRIRSREHLENKTLDCGSAINTYQNSIGRKEQSPLSFFYHDRMNFDDDENMLKYMQESIKITNKIGEIEKQLKKKIRYLDSEKENLGNDNKSKTDNDEKKINCLVKGVGEIAELHPSSYKFFNFIKEGVQDWLQRILSRENFKNISLLDAVQKTKNEITKVKVEREGIEWKLNEIQDKQKLLKEADEQYKELKSQFKKWEQDKKKFVSQIEWLKSREEEIIKRMDLDEIDLYTDRLGVFGVEVSEDKRPHKSQKHPRVPQLDLEKIYKMREEDDEYEEEEEESERDAHSHGHHTINKSEIMASSESDERIRELRNRKEQVIAMLNKTYGEDDKE